MKTRQMHRIILLAGMTLASSTSQSQVTEAWFENFDYAGGLDVAVDIATDACGSVCAIGCPRGG